MKVVIFAALLTVSMSARAWPGMALGSGGGGSSTTTSSGSYLGSSGSSTSSTSSAQQQAEQLQDNLEAVTDALKDRDETSQAIMQSMSMGGSSGGSGTTSSSSNTNTGDLNVYGSSGTSNNTASATANLSYMEGVDQANQAAYSAAYMDAVAQFQQQAAGYQTATDAIKKMNETSKAILGYMK